MLGQHRYNILATVHPHAQDAVMTFAVHIKKKSRFSPMPAGFN